jgi:hypothetical protein
MGDFQLWMDGAAAGCGSGRRRWTGGKKTTRTNVLYEKYRGLFENNRIAINNRDPNQVSIYSY